MMPRSENTSVATLSDWRGWPCALLAVIVPADSRGVHRDAANAGALLAEVVQFLDIMLEKVRACSLELF
jgi:hypothetical protein